ncbi:outer membrane protein TolC [Lentimicrobium saccharophilum]|uniref:Outer membrane protein TolC n=2 Tax=Lentimicrobium saccharophilum TaxID=1678841 RepID=A0A0S7BRT4_9BACT|nr:outer membrane protein TolC [Lentimicrobium saccharophilum]
MLLLLGTSGFLGAQQTLTLDLAGARKTALEYNKTIANADLATLKAAAAVREAIANGLPQLNAAVDYSNALGAKISIRFAEGMPPSEIDIKPQSNFNLNLTQLIFSGNYIVGVQTAKLYQSMAGISKEKSELDIIAQVTDAYQLVLISEELLRLLEQNQANLEGLYEKTAALETFGIIEKTDVDQLSVQVNTLKNAVKSSERQLELATNMLRLLLGVPVDTQLELTDRLDQMLSEAEALPLAESFRVEDQVDFRLLNQQELVSRKMIDMQRANALPTISGYYRYTYKLLKPDFDMTPANMVGLQMNIPIFSSGVRMAQVKQARIDLETTQNNKSLLSDQLKIQEKQLRFNYNSALETYLNQKNNVEVSRRVYASLKLKYEQGIISGLDLITADNNYLKAETDYISAMMQVLQSGVQLQKLYGKLD